MPENVCRECRRIIEKGQKCLLCNASSLTTDWSGYAVIINPQKSKIAKKLGVEMPGKYALKVR